MLLLIEFVPQFDKSNVTHFVYVHDNQLYASNTISNIPGFESMIYTGSVDVTVAPGSCVHYFVKRSHGYAMISKFNPTNNAISFSFTATEWYAYALNPATNDVLTFFVDTGPFNVPAKRLFDEYNSTGPMQGPLDYYTDMVTALSVSWSPGVVQGLAFSSEYNLELYDDVFNFKFTL